MAPLAGVFAFLVKRLVAITILDFTFGTGEQWKFHSLHHKDQASQTNLITQTVHVLVQLPVYR